MAYRLGVLVLLAHAACVDLSRPPIPIVDAGGMLGTQDGSPDRAPDLEPGADAADDGPAPDLATDGDPPDAEPGVDGAPDLPPDAPLLALGQRCSDPGQCASGLCTDGYCCDSACSGTCQACDLAGAEGTCSPVPAGSDPRDDCDQEAAASCGRDGTCDGAGACQRYPVGSECAPGSCTAGTEYAASTCDGAGVCQPGSSRSCSPNVCTSGSCSASCASQGDCQSGFFCDGSTCSLRRALAAACTQDHQCASGHCNDGVCCGSPCAQSCYACNVPGSVGVCTPVPVGQDPQGACVVESASTCGRSGGCDGLGTCRLYAAGVSCAAQSCSGSIESAARSCNGLGVCLGPSTRDCSPYLCGGNACAQSCTTSSQCKSGFYCSGTSCVAFGPGPALHWKLDEASGTRAEDASGNGRVGTYVGASGLPAPSALVPSVSFPNPASRAFTAASRHAVRLDPAPAAIKPSTAITISLWWRTTKLDTGHNPPAASEAISLGNNYFIRIRAADIYWTRRASGSYVSCPASLTNHLDGGWHHVAAVLAPEGMKLYIDGSQRCTNTLGAPMLYDKGTALYVARHGEDETQWDFDGNIDDVRIYARALPPAEVAALAAGF